MKLVLESGQEFYSKNAWIPPQKNEIKETSLLKSLDQSNLHQSSLIAECVFNTSMTGYQEILTDPSYHNQIITYTYPLIGNYGVSREYSESLHIQARAIVCKELCDFPSHHDSVMTFRNFLHHHRVAYLEGVDTRSLTLAIRDHGAVKSGIFPNEVPLNDALSSLKNSSLTSNYKEYTTRTIQHIPHQNAKFRVGLVDYGVKKSIISELLKRGAEVYLLPSDLEIRDVPSLGLDGVVLSNGPGDPKDMSHSIELVNYLQTHYPLFAICMGHQVFAMANQLKTYKLKFGHRGGNHPVKNLSLEKHYLTAQNHGYAVSANGIEKTDLEISEINLTDQSLEGLQHKKFKAFSVQYHPEAGPGPSDTLFHFDTFFHYMNQNTRKTNHAPS